MLHAEHNIEITGHELIYETDIHGYRLFKVFYMIDGKYETYHQAQVLYPTMIASAYYHNLN